MCCTVKYVMKIYAKLSLYHIILAFLFTVTADIHGQLEKHKAIRQLDIKNSTAGRASSNDNSTNRSYIYLRRYKPSFQNDPEFQKLLNQYRGMVHKFDKPPDESTKLYDLSNGAFNTKSDNPNVVPSDGRYLKIPHEYGGMLSIPDKYLMRWTSPSQSVTQAVAFKNRPRLIKGHHPKWGRGVTRQGDQQGNQQADPESNQHSTTEKDAEGIILPGPDKGAAGAAVRFTTRTTTTKRRRRTTPYRVSFEEQCDYIAYYCLKAYDTGKICARTMYYAYSTFDNYCMMDFVNCMERYDIWQVAHMGECFKLRYLSEYLHYPYLDDYFLDQYYVIDDF